jgi:hypothetical protein
VYVSLGTGTIVGAYFKKHLLLCFSVDCLKVAPIKIQVNPIGFDHRVQFSSLLFGSGQATPPFYSNMVSPYPPDLRDTSLFPVLFPTHGRTEEHFVRCKFTQLIKLYRYVMPIF